MQHRWGGGEIYFYISGRSRHVLCCRVKHIYGGGGGGGEEEEEDQKTSVQANTNVIIMRGLRLVIIGQYILLIILFIDVYCVP